jgi:ribonuclease HI
MGKNKYFVVWDGKEPGIYSSWDKCKNQIHGYANAKYMGFATEAEAKQALLSPYWDYIGKKAIKKTPSEVDIQKYGHPIKVSLAVDAACSGNPGVMEYRGVYTETGEEIFRQGPFKQGTNNIGEFLALVHGLAVLKQTNQSMPIYTDSVTALSWVKNRKSKTNLKECADNTQIFDLIARAEKWLKENETTTQILKWETTAWGEIPADFGRK